MDEHIALRMIILGLGNSLQKSKFGNDMFENSKIYQVLKSFFAVRMHQHFTEFLAHALGGDADDQRIMFLQSLLRSGIKSQSKAIFKTDGAEDAEIVLLNALFWVVDEAQNFIFQICLSTHKVVNFFRDRIIKHAIDREVPSQGVFLGGGKEHGIGAATIGIAGIGAKGGDFKMVSLFLYQDDTEIFANAVGFCKERFNLFGFGIRRDIDVLRFVFQDDIAHGTTGIVGGVSGSLEFLYDSESGGLHY